MTRMIVMVIAAFLAARGVAVAEPATQPVPAAIGAFYDALSAGTDVPKLLAEAT